MSLPYSSNSQLSEPSPAMFSSESKITRGHSCVLCRRRKIKCNGQNPCQNCIRTRVECIAPEVVPARKQKRNFEHLIARLRKCEDIIAKNGLKVEDEDGLVDTTKELNRESVQIDQMGHLYSESSMIPTRPADEGGRLIVQGGKSIYIENSIWENVFIEVREETIQAQLHRHSSPSDDETDDHVPAAADYSSLLFGRLMVTNSLTSSHPSPVHIFRLWQTFIDNIHPLTHLLHAPTMQPLILQASGDLEKIPANLEALMFAIYHISIVSLDEQECLSMFGESKPDLLARYSAASQQALCNAKVLSTPDIMVLQALTLYLTSIRSVANADTIWCLSGIASRIGQRIGLHREFPNANLTILELEIRRRLWWQILTLEGHSSFLSGLSGQSVMGASYATFLNIISTRPSGLLYVNDSDLDPNMREPPRESTGVTEMLFCCVRYELAKSVWTPLLSPEASNNTISSQIKVINDTEAMLEERFIKYADPCIPLHFLSTLVVRIACANMRLRAYAPQKYNNSLERPQVERDAAFLIALQMIEYDNQGHDVKTKAMLKRFAWHVKLFFQLEAFVFVLSELRLRTTGEQVDRAWQQVESSYRNHPEMMKNIRNKLWFAVGNLCLKAWEERVKSKKVLNGGMQMQLERLEFIKELYAQRRAKATGKNLGTGQDIGTDMGLVPHLPNDVTFEMGGDTLNSASGGWPTDMGRNSTVSTPYVSPDTQDLGAMDWEYWQTLFDDCSVPLFS